MDLRRAWKKPVLRILSLYEVDQEPVFVMEDPDGRKVELWQE